jgi:hypothetical protein
VEMNLNLFDGSLRHMSLMVGQTLVSKASQFAVAHVTKTA